MRYEISLFFVAVLLLFSGCVGQTDVTPFAKTIPEVQAFLAENPDANITARLLTQREVEILIEDIKTDCKGDMWEIPYWLVQITTVEKKLEIYINEQGTETACIVEKDNTSAKLNNCSSHTQCNDNNTATDDKCAGSPKKCIYTAINTCRNNDDHCPTRCSYNNDNDCPIPQQSECTKDAECDDGTFCTEDTCHPTTGECTYKQKTTCKNNDKCCTQGCNYNNDNDCPIRDECQMNSDCDDGVASTQDVCSGTPKTCYHTQKTCSETGGQICSSGTSCSGSTVTTSDSTQCCFGTCPDISSCQTHNDCDDGVASTQDVCSGTPKVCSNTAATCVQRGGRFCTAPKVCPIPYVSASDSTNCCMVSCLADCQSTHKLVNEECVLKTCAEREGIVCPTGEACSQDPKTTSDTTECCVASCKTLECLNVNCKSNEECVDGACVLKTCAEMNGYICTGNKICSSDIFVKEAADTDSCCTFPCKDKYDIAISGPVNIGSNSNPNEDRCWSNDLTITFTNTSDSCKSVDYRVLLDGVEFKKSFINVCGIGRNTIWNLPQLLNKELTVVLDPDNEIDELDETNNVFEHQFSFGKKDLYVKSISYLAGMITYEIEVDESTVDCPSVPTDVYIDSVKFTDFKYGGTALVNGDIYTIHWFSYPLDPGQHEIRIVIDPNNKIEETDETNNESTQVIQV